MLCDFRLLRSQYEWVQLSSVRVLEMLLADAQEMESRVAGSRNVFEHYVLVLADDLVERCSCRKSFTGKTEEGGARSGSQPIVSGIVSRQSCARSGQRRWTLLSAVSIVG
jgi:hypothetical protein